jgi:hypothetical protein
VPEPLPEVTESTTKPVTEPESVIVDEEINPVARRVEIEAMLSQPAKGLPMTKIALRAELEKINNQLVPEEKKLRKNIMAVVKSKALSKTEYQDIFKKNGGSRYLTNVNLPELDKVLKSIKNARPHKIGNKTVITKNTENLIQTTRQNLEESGKLKDGDYNSILRMLGYKTDKYIDSNNFITNKEGLNIIHAMKRKSLMGFAVVEERINDIVKELGAPSQIVPPITKASFDVSWGKKYGDKLNSIFVRTARVERILDRIDGKDNGLLIRTFYNPVNQATSKKISGKSIVMEDFRKLLKDNNIDIGKLMNSKVKIDNVELTSSEKIGIYLSNLNKDNLRHLKEGNGFSDKLIEDVTNSLTESEKKIAEWLQEYFKDGYDSINEAKLYVTGEELGKTENYFPIRIESRANPSYKYWEQVAKTDSLSFITEWASGGIEKGFTKERTGEAVQAVNLDSMFIFLNHLEAVEHYKAFAPVIADLQLIMKSDKFKNSFINKAGYNTYQVLDKWLKQVADINPLEPTNHAESVMRTLRVNAATAALGLNITTAMKQPISFSNGAAEIGLINSFKGMFTYLQNPNKTRDFIKEFSPQIYNRSFEREIAEEKQMRKPGSVFSGKLTPREVFMILSTTMDKITVSSIWIGAFEKSLNSNINDLSEAAYYADSVIRKTQPFFDIKDLPEYYRSGEFMKTITRFTNQLNNNWNYYVYDIYGKAKAGRISKLEALRRILLAFIVPSLIIGAITRARLPKDWKEAAFDLASQGLSSLPIIGTFITSGMNGFTGGGLITTEIFSEISEITNKITNGKFDTLWKNILPFAGYATGIPVSQPKRIIETIIDIAQGKFDDWRELIWSKYSIDKYNKKDIDSIFEVPKDKNSKKTSPFDNSSKTPFNRRVKNPFK